MSHTDISEYESIESFNDAQRISSTDDDVSSIGSFQLDNKFPRDQKIWKETNSESLNLHIDISQPTQFTNTTNSNDDNVKKLVDDGDQNNQHHSNNKKEDINKSENQSPCVDKIDDVDQNNQQHSTNKKEDINKSENESPCADKIDDDNEINNAYSTQTQLYTQNIEPYNTQTQVNNTNIDSLQVENKEPTENKPHSTQIIMIRRANENPNKMLPKLNSQVTDETVSYDSPTQPQIYDIEEETTNSIVGTTTLDDTKADNTSTHFPNQDLLGAEKQDTKELHYSPTQQELIVIQKENIEESKDSLAQTQSDDEQEERIKDVCDSPTQKQSSDIQEQKVEDMCDSPTQEQSNDIQEQKIEDMCDSPTQKQSNDIQEQKVEDMCDLSTQKQLDEQEQNVEDIHDFATQKQTDDIQEQKVEDMYDLSAQQKIDDVPQQSADDVYDLSTQQQLDDVPEQSGDDVHDLSTQIQIDDIQQITGHTSNDNTDIIHICDIAEEDEHVKVPSPVNFEEVTTLDSNLVKNKETAHKTVSTQFKEDDSDNSSMEEEDEEEYEEEDEEDEEDEEEEGDNLEKNLGKNDNSKTFDQHVSINDAISYSKPVTSTIPSYLSNNKFQNIYTTNTSGSKQDDITEHTFESSVDNTEKDTIETHYDDNDTTICRIHQSLLKCILLPSTILKSIALIHLKEDEDKIAWSMFCDHKSVNDTLENEYIKRMCYAKTFSDMLKMTKEEIDKLFEELFLDTQESIQFIQTEIHNIKMIVLPMFENLYQKFMKTKLKKIEDYNVFLFIFTAVFKCTKKSGNLSFTNISDDVKENLFLIEREVCDRNQVINKLPNPTQLYWFQTAMNLLSTINLKEILHFCFKSNLTHEVSVENEDTYTLKCMANVIIKRTIFLQDEEEKEKLLKDIQSKMIKMISKSIDVYFSELDEDTTNKRSLYRTKQNIVLKDSDQVKRYVIHANILTDHYKKTSQAPRIWELNNLLNVNNWQKNMDAKRMSKNIESMLAATKDFISWCKRYDDGKNMTHDDKKCLLRTKTMNECCNDILGEVMIVSTPYEVMKPFHVSPVIVYQSVSEAEDMYFQAKEVSKACILFIMLSMVKRVVFISSKECNGNTVIITSGAKQYYEPKQNDMNIILTSGDTSVLSGQILDRVLQSMKKKESIKI